MGSKDFWGAMGAKKPELKELIGFFRGRHGGKEKGEESLTKDAPFLWYVFHPPRCHGSVFPVQKSKIEHTSSSFGWVRKLSGGRLHPPISWPNFSLPSFPFIPTKKAADQLVSFVNGRLHPRHWQSAPHCSWSAGKRTHFVGRSQQA